MKAQRRAQSKPQLKQQLAAKEGWRPTVLLAVVYCSLLVVILSSRANAQTSADPQVTSSAVAVISAEKSDQPLQLIALQLSGQLTVETARSADESAPASYSGSYLGIFSAAHKRTNVTATLKTSYSREYSYDRADGSNGGFDNPLLSVAKAWNAGEHFSSSIIDRFALSLGASVGVDNESRRRTFLWSNGVSAIVSKKLDQLSLAQSLGYIRSFYEYDIRANGVVNSPNTLRSVSSISYAVNDRLAIGGEFIFSHSVSFQGVGRTTEWSTFSADYAFTDTVSGSVGASTERGTLEPDGTSNRVRGFAPEAAQYFVDLILKL